MIVAIEKFAEYTVTHFGIKKVGKIVITNRIHANPMSEAKELEVSAYFIERGGSYREAVWLITYYSSMWTEAMTKALVDEFKITKV